MGVDHFGTRGATSARLVSRGRDGGGRGELSVTKTVTVYQFWLLSILLLLLFNPSRPLTLRTGGASGAKAKSTPSK